MITSFIFLPFVKGRVPSWHFLFTYKLSEPKIECFYIFVDAATRLFFSTFYPFSITDVDKGWRWICWGHWVLISILIPLLQCGAQCQCGPDATISVTLDIWYVPSPRSMSQKCKGIFSVDTLDKIESIVAVSRKK